MNVIEPKAVLGLLNHLYAVCTACRAATCTLLLCDHMVLHVSTLLFFLLKYHIISSIGASYK